MARERGTFNFSSTFEVLNKAPLDARLIVDTKANLITPSIWEDHDSNVWIYTGIVVSVITDPSTENNGLYFLTDNTAYTSYDSWLKLGGSVDPGDPSGTSWQTFQLNNGDNGVILKDSSGNLEVVTFDGSTYANVTAGDITVNHLKIDSLNGTLYAIDGSVYSTSSSFPLKAYQGTLTGNGTTSNFTVDHSLGTLRQSITIFDDDNEVTYPNLERGTDTDIIKFVVPPQPGTNYEIIILGF